MSLSRFFFTDRAVPRVEIGIGDSRVPGAAGVWGTSRWGGSGAVWGGTEPEWLDVTCETRNLDCDLGRARTTDRFVVGRANITVDNASGWADPKSPASISTLVMRPGRSVRIGVDHATLGYRCLFRGFIDTVSPTYEPLDPDTVVLSCVDALGEVNRAKMLPLPAPTGDGQTTDARIWQILDRASWPAAKRRISPSGATLIADELGGQAADLLGQAADSEGGAIFGDLDGNIVFRPRDWQTYTPGTPVDGTIGNVETGDVCPTEWNRPFDRADIATRVIMGRAPDDAVQVDDIPGQALYGIEPFERTDLLTQQTSLLTTLANRYLRTRSAATAPRVRAVSLDAATSTASLDLQASVDIFKPSRYRCRLAYPRGLVFDAEHFATGVRHVITPVSWTTEINLDLASVYAAAGARWGQAQGWDRATWATVAILDEVRRALEHA